MLLGGGRIESHDDQIFVHAMVALREVRRQRLLNKVLRVIAARQDQPDTLIAPYQVVQRRKLTWFHRLTGGKSVFGKSCDPTHWLGHVVVKAYAPVGLMDQNQIGGVQLGCDVSGDASPILLAELVRVLPSQLGRHGKYNSTGDEGDWEAQGS